MKKNLIFGDDLFPVGGPARSGMKIGGVFDFVCYDGRLPKDHPSQPSWQDDAKNVVTNAFMTAALQILFNSSTATANFYVGLMELTGSVTTADTLAAHAGWKRCNAYNGAQKLWQTAAASGRQITNSANKAQFVMSGSSTIWGGFIVANSAAKNATTPTLVCVAQFSGSSRSVASGDTVEVTYQLSMDDDAS